MSYLQYKEYDIDMVSFQENKWWTNLSIGYSKTTSDHWMRSWQLNHNFKETKMLLITRNKYIIKLKEFCIFEIDNISDFI